MVSIGGKLVFRLVSLVIKSLKNRIVGYIKVPYNKVMNPNFNEALDTVWKGN